MNFSKGWIRATQFALGCAGVLMLQSAAAAATAAAGYPLVCQGPVNLEMNGAWTFTWSMAAASATAPGQMQCAWLDRAPRGTELIPGPKPPPGQPQPGPGNHLVSKVSCPNLLDKDGQIPLAPGQYIEVMVLQDATTHYLDVQSWVGLVNPPFPAAPVEFKPATACTK